MRRPRVAKRIATVIVTIVMAIPLPERAYAAVVADVRADAEWIMSARLSDGAIANYVDKRAIWPYLSNFAAMGLARATEITKNKTYVDAAWAWLSWYRSHMDAQGFVTDYIVQGGQPVSTGFMDSTDAYAATFLMALRDAYRANPDLRRLRTYGNSVAAAVRAMEATQTADGLTWAKPTWKVKYLMDQAEVYAGFRSAAELAQTLRDTTLTTRALRGADRVRTGVAALWNASTAAFDWAVHTDGARIATDWRYLYSDAMQQIWAIAFGLVPTPRDGPLGALFVSKHPSWATPQASVLFSGGVTETAGYWPIAALGLQRIRHPAAVAGATRIRQAALAANRAWPFTTATAGQLILTQTMTLAGARLLDASTAAAISTSTTTYGTTAVSSTPTPKATKEESSPRATATPQRPLTTPSPSPYARVAQSVGPAGIGVSVGPSGAGVTASMSPSATATPAPKDRGP